MAYDWTKPEECLELIKENILNVMKVEENRHVKHRTIHSIYSQSIRVIAIVLFAFGILWPIISVDNNSK